MIVVAIIGILASIALPAYQDYIARAQATESLVLMAGLKPTITEVYADTGSVIGINSGAVGIPSTASIEGKYVASVTVANGSIFSRFKSTGVSRELQDKRLILTPYIISTKLNWECSTTAALKLVPSVCRTYDDIDD